MILKIYYLCDVMVLVDYNNLDLRNKTFLDFTDDPKVINEIAYDVADFLSNITERSRAVTFWEFTDYANDKKLIAEIEKVFKKYKPSFNE